MQSSHQSITPEQRQKLANLLKSRRSDSKVIGKTGLKELDFGQLLPRMSAALQSEARYRLEEVVAALETERVIVAMPVEKPHETVSELPSVKTRLGQATCVFSSAHTFAAWQNNVIDGSSRNGCDNTQNETTSESSDYRPVPMSPKKVALTAIATGQIGFILDPGQEHCLLIPREAVEALAVDSSWLPPWRDLELLDELHEIAKTQDALSLGLSKLDIACDTKIEETTPLEKSLVLQFSLYTVVVQLLVVEGSYLATNPRELAKIMAKLSTSARLQATCWQVEFQPKLVSKS